MLVVMCAGSRASWWGRAVAAATWRWTTGSTRRRGSGPDTPTQSSMCGEGPRRRSHRLDQRGKVPRHKLLAKHPGIKTTSYTPAICIPVFAHFRTVFAMPRHSFCQLSFDLEKLYRLFRIPFTPFLTFCVAYANYYCRREYSPVNTSL